MVMSLWFTTSRDADFRVSSWVVYQCLIYIYTIVQHLYLYLAFPNHFSKQTVPLLGNCQLTSPIMQCLSSCAHRPFSDAALFPTLEIRAQQCALGLRAEVIVSTEEVEENVLKKRLPAEADSDWRTTLVLFPHTEKIDSPWIHRKTALPMEYMVFGYCNRDDNHIPVVSKQNSMNVAVYKQSVTCKSASFVCANLWPKKVAKKSHPSEFISGAIQEFWQPKSCCQNFKRKSMATLRKAPASPWCLQDIPRP